MLRLYPQKLTDCSSNSSSTLAIRTIEKLLNGVLPGTSFWSAVARIETELLQSLAKTRNGRKLRDLGNFSEGRPVEAQRQPLPNRLPHYISLIRNGRISEQNQVSIKNYIK